MALGSWNLGQLRKRASYVGLKDFSYEVIDTSPLSDQIFSIRDFPSVLTAGKNLFKIKASTNVLVKNSTIHIEVLDSNGNPLYYEPIKYIEADGTRVIAIYVYDDVPYGIATVYVAGRVHTNPFTGQQYTWSNDVNSDQYLNLPNALWSHTLTIAPEKRNSSEIIYTSKPEVTLSEILQPYNQPQNINTVVTQSISNAKYTIKPIPLMETPVNTGQAFQGDTSLSGLPTFRGSVIAPKPQSLSAALSYINASSDNILAATTPRYVTAVNKSLFESTSPFFTTSMSRGDVITITNPLIQTIRSGATYSSSLLIPDSQKSTESSSSFGTAVNSLSGSYRFIIDRIISDTEAEVVLYDGFKNSADNLTGGWFQVTLDGTPKQVIRNISLSGAPVCSFTAPYVISQSATTQSFAEISVSNLEPATGDVYKIKTFYKAAGQFGDYIDGGETILERDEILEDSSSFSSTADAGTFYTRMGLFNGLADFNTYWTTGYGLLASQPLVFTERLLTPVYDNTNILGGIHMDQAVGQGLRNEYDCGIVQLSGSYHPELIAETEYILTMDVYTNNAIKAGFAQLDIYIDTPTAVQAFESRDAFIKDTLTTYQSSVDASPFADGPPFGTRIGSVQGRPGERRKVQFRFFNPGELQTMNMFFIQRKGEWTFADVSIKAVDEFGFTPNFAKITTLIDSQFLNTPLAFKILFYDFLGNEAKTEAELYPVIFTGAT